jgi:type II secretion system protein N
MALGETGAAEASQRLPRLLLAAALPLAALVLVLVFTLILFPYERFRDVTAARIAQATGASVSLTDLDGGLSVGGPFLRATNLLLRWPDGRELLLERARFRPAWSFSWLRGEPALRVHLSGPAGSVAGTLWPGLGPAFEGGLQGVQLSLLPLEQLADPFPALGRLDAEVEVRAGAEGPVGEIRFEAWDGSISLPQMPFGIPYQEAHGEIERSESGSVTVPEFELSGPMLSATVEGSIAASRRPEDGELDLEIDLVVVDPGVRNMFQPYGIQLDPDGAARLRVSGTVSRPLLDERR